MPLSAQECRDNAAKCESMADSLGLADAGVAEMVREVAVQWRKLAADADARAADPLWLGVFAT
jgi:hypothetical protein